MGHIANVDSDAVDTNKVFLQFQINVSNTYLGRKAPGGLSVRHPGGFSKQWCLKQVQVKPRQSMLPDNVAAFLPVVKMTV